MIKTVYLKNNKKVLNNSFTHEKDFQIINKIYNKTY